MSRLLGHCDEFERMVGMPAPSGGCCWSCLDDDDEYMMEMYGDSDNLGPQVPTDGWFRVCCAHYNAFEEWRKQSPVESSNE